MLFFFNQKNTIVFLISSQCVTFTGLCGFVCLCWGFTAQSTQWGHVKRGQFALPHVYWAGLVLLAVNQYCAHSFAGNWQLPFLYQRKGENDRRKYFMIKHFTSNEYPQSMVSWRNKNNNFPGTLFNLELNSLYKLTLCLHLSLEYRGVDIWISCWCCNIQ